MLAGLPFLALVILVALYGQNLPAWAMAICANAGVGQLTLGDLWAQHIFVYLLMVTPRVNRKEIESNWKVGFGPTF